MVPYGYVASPDGAEVLVDGRARGSLAQVIKRARGRPVRDAPGLLGQFCEGLALLHKSGWAHGDLRPGDVLVMADGSVRLADSGPSALDEVRDCPPSAGRSDYLPPGYWTELVTARGISVRESADIWAFGVIGCQLLTGRLPFPGRTARARSVAAIGYVSSGAPEPRTAGLTPQGRRLISDCLNPDRAASLEVTAPRLADRLDRLRQEKVPITVTAARGWRRPAGRHRRRPARI
ncbi:MAG: protein kinase [Nocardiopsaceae bacterium]|nr:protein kinase [Nocardiopsaceae bacterium]